MEQQSAINNPAGDGDDEFDEVKPLINLYN